MTAHPSRRLFRDLRRKARLSQRQVAEHAGVSQQGVNSFENGGNGLALWRMARVVPWLGEQARAK